MPGTADLHNWIERSVIDANDEEIGHADGFYVDDRSGEPAFLLVKGGHFGIHLHFVPLEGATLVGDDAIKVAWDKDTINHAPKISADDELSPEEEERLFDHYGLHFGDRPAGAGALVLTRIVVTTTR
jgi:hypothetical protein